MDMVDSSIMDVRERRERERERIKCLLPVGIEGGDFESQIVVEFCWATDKGKKG